MSNYVFLIDQAHNRMNPIHPAQAQKLMDEGLGVEMEYEQARNQKKALEQKLKTLRSQQGKTVVRAPFSGVIDDIFVRNDNVIQIDVLWNISIVVINRILTQ